MPNDYLIYWQQDSGATGKTVVSGSDKMDAITRFSSANPRRQWYRCRFIGVKGEY